MNLLRRIIQFFRLHDFRATKTFFIGPGLYHEETCQKCGNKRTVGSYQYRFANSFITFADLQGCPGKNRKNEKEPKE